MREKEKFGKKPVRRSTSDKNESTRVYKPRTSRALDSETNQKNDADQSKSDYKNDSKSNNNDRSGRSKATPEEAILAKPLEINDQIHSPTHQEHTSHALLNLKQRRRLKRTDLAKT